MIIFVINYSGAKRARGLSSGRDNGRDAVSYGAKGRQLRFVRSFRR